MEFRRQKRLTIWPKELSYFQMREFEIKNDSAESERVISEFIKTKYFHWQEQRIDGVPWTINKEEKIVDMNFHGIYDIKLLSISDYQLVSFNEFNKFFIDSMYKEIGDDDLIPEINNYLKSFKETSKYYILTANNSKRHQLTVFDYFYSGFVVNVEAKTISVVEFGLD